ncbi:secretion/DNA translocation related CpaE-like protein [Nocardia transvalensis]|uniref:Secretion/DNA translocation related CpaE-like protein n=1 Tax=Nocardia transvalensis TaxID=37333 RepID=A0A7W9PD27_9NOCA|nr:septum site-determining protein Ssd [Nocardia transvalensis]MBB5913394.1 secretion/DNA translocation related CpaE-like protein [Nocardia transvalensis]
MNSLAANQDSGGDPTLVLVADQRLRAEVGRVAAAADRRVAEARMPVGRHAWSGAVMVILDTAAARDCTAAGYPRRAAVLLVTEGEPGLLDWQAAAAVGAERVLALPDSADVLIESFADHTGRGPGDGAVVAVVGGVGGAGASTLAAAVALTGAASRFRPDTILIDGDPLGGGIDLLLGLESEPGLRWPDLVVEEGRVAAAALHDALPSPSPGLAVLACVRAVPGADPPAIGSSAARAVVEAGRSAGDLVVCDISAERGPHADHMLDAADLVVLVVPARLRAVAAARAVSARVHRRNPHQALIVRGPAPGGLRAAEIAEALALPVLAAIRPQPALAARLERTGLGSPRGPLRTAASAVLAALMEDLDDHAQPLAQLRTGGVR